MPTFAYSSGQAPLCPSINNCQTWHYENLVLGSIDQYNVIYLIPPFMKIWRKRFLIQATTKIQKSLAFISSQCQQWQYILQHVYRYDYAHWGTPRTAAHDNASTSLQHQVVYYHPEQDIKIRHKHANGVRHTQIKTVEMVITIFILRWAEPRGIR